MFDRRIAILVALTALTGCNYKVNKIDDTQVSGSGLSYGAVAQKVFAQSCTSCHGSSGGVNLESYAAVAANLAGIERTVFQSGSMPKAPQPPLTAEQKALLRAWLDAGAPESGGAEGPVLPPAPALEPTFASIKELVIEKKCLQCHKPGGKAEEVPLSALSDLLDGSEPLVVPGRPEESLFFTVLLPEARFRMPPPRSGITPLTESETNIIKEWIQNGARD